MKKIIGSLSLFLSISIAGSIFAASKKPENQSQQAPAVQQKVTHRSSGKPPPAPQDESPTKPSEAAPASWAEKFEAGWKKGLYFQTKDKSYSLRFRVQLQPQFSYTNYSNKALNRTDATTFRMRRAKINWQGNVFSTNLDYNFQLNVAVSNLDELLEDAWIDYRFYNPLRVQFGQFKIPYIRQNITSAGRLQLVDKSIASEDFRFSTWNTATTTTCTVAGVTVNCPTGTTTTSATSIRRFDYDLGVMVHGDAWDNKFEYYAGVFNPTGFNRLNANTDLLYLGRIVWNPVGQYGYQESDLNYSKHPAITLAASGGYLKQNIANVNTKLTQAGVELGVKYKGFSLQSEGMFRNNGPLGIKDYNDVGYYAQLGYLFKEKFEIAGRVSQEFLGGQGSGTSPTNANAPGALPNNKNEFTGGFNYYIFQHDLKIQADYSYLTTQQNAQIGALADHRFRLQLQAWF